VKTLYILAGGIVCASLSQLFVLLRSKYLYIPRYILIVCSDAMEDELMFFYGRECPVCEKVRPKLDRLEDELNVSVARYEVWHDANNQAMLMKLGEGMCSGVPFILNMRTNKYFCGIDVSYDRLVEWAGGG